MRLGPLFLFPILLLYSGWFAFADSGPTTATAPKEEKQDWSLVLQTFGKKFSLYFTIEADDRHVGADAKGGPGSSLQSVFVSVPKDFKNADDFLDTLRKWIPDATVDRDKSDASLVHIKEKSLSNVNDYVLDRMITLQFKGNGDDLLGELVKQSSGSMEKDIGGGIDEPPGGAGREVSLDLKAVSFRSVLSECAPRKGDHVLWVASTFQRDGKLVTSVALASDP